MSDCIYNLPCDMDYAFAGGELHDAKILSATSEDGDLFLKLRSDVKLFVELTFKNAQVVQQEADPVGTYWLYSELYVLKDQGKYEINILHAGGRRTPYEMSIIADNVLTERCWNELFHRRDPFKIPADVNPE